MDRLNWIAAAKSRLTGSAGLRYGLQLVYTVAGRKK